MSTIKVDKLQGTSGSATAITMSGANATVGGTLAVTGIHTVGTNAVATSEGGGGATTNIVQGLAKWWVRHNDGSIADSFNNASITDNGTGDFSHGFTNDMRADSAYCVTGIAEDNNSRTAKVTFNTANAETQDGLLRYITGFESGTNGESTALDCNNTNVMIHGDLA